MNSPSKKVTFSPPARLSGGKERRNPPRCRPPGRRTPRKLVWSDRGVRPMQRSRRFGGRKHHAADRHRIAGRAKAEARRRRTSGVSGCRSGRLRDHDNLLVSGVPCATMTSGDRASEKGVDLRSAHRMVRDAAVVPRHSHAFFRVQLSVVEPVPRRGPGGSGRAVCQSAVHVRAELLVRDLVVVPPERAVHRHRLQFTCINDRACRSGTTSLC